VLQKKLKINSTEHETALKDMEIKLNQEKKMSSDYEEKVRQLNE